MPGCLHDEAGNAGTRLARPGRFRRIDREGRNEGGKHLGAVRSSDSSQLATERQNIRFVEPVENRMTHRGNGGFFANFGAVYSCPQLRCEPEVAVDRLASLYSVGLDRVPALRSNMSSEQVRQSKIGTGLAPLVVQTRLSCRDQV